MSMSAQPHNISADLAVLHPVEISASWDDLETAAAGLREAEKVSQEVESIQSRWQTIGGHYEEPSSEEAVRQAMDDIPGYASSWSQALVSCGETLDSFCVRGRELEGKAQNLVAQAMVLEVSLAASSLFDALSPEDESDEDSELRGRIREHNAEVQAVNQQWEELKQQSASAIRSAGSAGARNSDIPEIDAERHGVSTTLASNGSSSSLDGESSIVAALTPLLQVVSSGQDPVEEADELYEAAMAEDATGEDIHNFYDHIATLSPEEIQEFAQQSDRVHLESLPQPSSEADYAEWPTGEDGAEWWDGLEEEQEGAMLEYIPLIVGNTQGVPYSKRNEGNQRALTRLQDNDRLNEQLTHGQRERLAEIEEALEPETVQPGAVPGTRYLLTLDMGQVPEQDDENDGYEPVEHPPDPLAAISVGDPSTADTMSYNVAGMNSNTERMSDEVRRAQGLYEGQAESGQNHAVVSWIGYEAPDDDDTMNSGESVFHDTHAERGGWALAHELDGYQETMQYHEGSQPNVHVNSHSYGTNTVAHALTETRHNVDSVAMYGSAGIPEDVASDASDLNVENLEGTDSPAVFATETSSDEWGYIGRRGEGRLDPTDSDFGAFVFSSEGDGLGGVDGRKVNGHNQTFYEERKEDEWVEDPSDPWPHGYLDVNSQSYEAIVMIMDGRADEIDWDELERADEIRAEERRELLEGRRGIG